MLCRVIRNDLNVNCGVLCAWGGNNPCLTQNGTWRVHFCRQFSLSLFLLGYTFARYIICMFKSLTKGRENTDDFSDGVRC